MKIYLNAQRTIREIQKDFNSVFPFLKLEFFRHRHGTGEGSPVKEKYPPRTALIEVSGALREGTMEIMPSDPVAEVESRFGSFGLPVQVFRKQKGVWIETTTTDRLSLKEQNEMGQKASGPENKEPSERYIDWE